MIAMMATKITTIATIVPVEMNFFRANGGAGVTVWSEVKKKMESEFCLYKLKSNLPFTRLFGGNNF